MKFLTRQAINRGIFGGNKFFASIAVAIGFVRLLQKISGVGPRTVYTHKLKDDEVLVVTNKSVR